MTGSRDTTGGNQKWIRVNIQKKIITEETTVGSSNTHASDVSSMQYRDRLQREAVKLIQVGKTDAIIILLLRKII